MAPVSNTCAGRCEQPVASLQVVGCAETDRQSPNNSINYRDQRHRCSAVAEIPDTVPPELLSPLSPCKSPDEHGNPNSSELQERLAEGSCRGARSLRIGQRLSS